MNPRLYDSAAMSRIGAGEKYGHGFSASLNASLEALRLYRLNLTEETAWKLIRRFVGPQCPMAAEDAITCVNLMDAEMQCVIQRDGATVFVIRRNEVTLDSESVPPWRPA